MDVNYLLNIILHFGGNFRISGLNVLFSTFENSVANYPEVLAQKYKLPNKLKHHEIELTSTIKSLRNKRF